ncbi:hypothetical protein AB9N12_02565 [Bacteroides sp. AN502(2024)]|uniref:hypothetical protein n=1 Tax=Bacteroides sp. AN502(2024) TaxID=3160599 RepID=UPI003518B619
MKQLICILLLVCGWRIALPLQAQKHDEYWSTPRGTYEERRAQFLNYYSENGNGHPLYSVFRQAARAASGRPLEMNKMEEVFSVIKSNRDCNDFTLNCLIRMVYLDKKQPFFPEEMKRKIEDCILDFKYWWDDARRDTTYRCYHTENHQALYHTAELLAGQLYKKTRFADGNNGRWHIAHAKKRLERWLDFRFRFGFSEWMSTYYEVEVLLLTNLYDYAEDATLREKARIVLDLLMFDVALNNYKGFMGSSSGRAYAHSLIMGAHHTSPLTKLVFGVGTYERDEVIAPVALATSAYRCPELITRIAVDYRTPYVNRQRISINAEDAADYGLDLTDEIDCHLFWGMQEFIHPTTIRMSKQLSEKYDVWPYRNYDNYIRRYDDETARYGHPVSLRLDRFALSEANVMTLRTPHYMLSSVMDYRKGAPGYQQHVWQATLGNRALVYTNHPGGKNLRWSPNYWSGNEILPRAAQSGSVVVCIYNIPESQRNDYTHAYFPLNEFDETHRSGHWIFARKGDGYIALYSANDTRLKADDRGEVCDLFAPGRQNIWICEMGEKSTYGSFARFVEKISVASVRTDGTEVTYNSPSEGTISYGWNVPWMVTGKEMPLRWNYRYDNPYCHAPFDCTRIEITHDNEQLILDWKKFKPCKR